MNKKNILIRITLAIILLMHSIPGIFNGGIKGFGVYLNQSGFAPVGLFLAWGIKLTHVVAAILLMLNKRVVLASLITVCILLAGIFMVHLPHGWFVVGGGQNGIEYNILLIACFVQLIMNTKK